MSDLELLACSQEERELTRASNRAALEDIAFDMADQDGAEQIIADLEHLIDKLQQRIN